MGKITQGTVNQLLTEKATDKIIWDTEVRGFGVRLTTSGVIRFIFNYRFRGKERRYTIGRHPEFTAQSAREEALALRVDVQNGHDPLEERNQWKTEPIFAALAQDYLEDARKRNRETSLNENDRMLKKHILPVLSERRLGEITERDITRLHDGMKSTPIQANRVLTLLTAIFNFGILNKWTTSNPVVGVTRYPEEKRERWLTVEEIQKFREALDRYADQSAANALRLLLLTGSRAGEVIKADWAEFDLSHGVWTKPSHHTKQRKVEHVPLSAPTIKLLEGMASKNASGPLFPGRDGEHRRTTLRRPWVQACKAAGLAEPYTIKGKRGPLTRYRPTLRIHDLRHNFASHLVSNGVSLQVVGKLLGHTTAQTTMRYAHLQDAPLRDAANQFGDILAQAKKNSKRSAQ